MSQKSSASAARDPATAAKLPAERVVRDIRRRTRKQHSAEEKIRVVLEGLRGEESIAALCRREGIAESLYYAWSKEFLEAGKRRLAGDTARAATTDEVMPFRRHSSAMLSSPRKPSSTTRIFSSAEWCLRVRRRMSRTTRSAGGFRAGAEDFWLIFPP